MKAYIFDMDGTLLDSLYVWARVDIEFLEKRGIVVPADYWDQISSMSFSECAVYTIERFGLPDNAGSLVQEWNDMAAYDYGHTVQMKPHAKEYLRVLRERGMKLAIATSLMPELIEAALNKQGIRDWFAVICREDEVENSKESPDIFLLTAARLGVSPSECIVFEDILAAVKSAKNAGMTVCGVYDEASANDWEQIKEAADYAILDFYNAPLLL